MSNLMVVNFCFICCRVMSDPMEVDTTQPLAMDFALK